MEGYTDAFAVSIAAPGRYVGLPLCGTALTGQQVAALARAVDLPERGVRMAFDPDSAGRKAAGQAIALMPPHDAGTQASRVTSLFVTKYGWTTEQVTRELVAAVERHYEGTPQRAGDWGSSLPAATTAVVRRAVAPYQRTTVRPRPAFPPCHGMQPGSVLRQCRHRRRGNARRVREQSGMMGIISCVT